MRKNSNARRTGPNFFGALLSGFASLATFAAPVQPINLPHRTAGQALASDWARLGGDMRAAISREESRAQKTA